MTVSSTTTKVSASGDGATAAFAYTFKVFADADLQVIIRSSAGVEVVKTLTTHYTVSGAGDDDGGTVTFTAGNIPASGETVVIRRALALTQGTDYVENDPFPAESHEAGLDRLTFLTQQLTEKIDRSLKLPVSADIASIAVTLPTPVADSYFKWDTAGTALVNSSTAAGQNLGSDGTVLLPYYSYSADPNTGMYRIGADNIGLAVGGSKVVDVTSTGINSTVIGATTPAAGTFSSITSGGDVLSDTDSTDSLGSTGVRWANLFVDDITVTTAVTAAGVITGATVEATGDTSASDNAAMGYTAGEGLILTGQGSSTDVTIKNSADATVISVPTGTTNATFGGSIVSDTDSTDDIGTTGVRWKELFVDDITMGGDQTIGGNLTVTGDLTINGTTVTNDATNVTVKDFLIEINSGAAASANDMGIIMERGSTGDNAVILWDESGDYFQVGTTTATGGSSGNLTVADGQLHADGLVLSGTSSNLGLVTTVDIDGGTLDGAVIGGSSAAAVTGTTVTGVSLVASQDLALATGATVTGIDNGAISTGSATLLATQGAINTAINTAVAAPGIQFLFEDTQTDTDQGNGKIWFDAAIGSATILYIDDLDSGGTSVNALVDTLDDQASGASAMIYLQEAGASGATATLKVTGSVTSASTYSKLPIDVEQVTGTFTDGDVVGMVIAISGADGAGSGDLLAANNLSDVDSASTSLSNLGGVGLGLVLALG